MMKAIAVICLAGWGMIGCTNASDNVPENIKGVIIDTPLPPTDTVPLPNAIKSPDTISVSHQTSTMDSIVDFAETLIGTPYKYGSTDPKQGFDCSGFITYLFNHFMIIVPRSSVGFTDQGKEISLKDAERGDLILFTGTDSTIRVVGHMGIVTSNTDTLRFIHSSSGKANGVVITPLNDYYKGRFVKVIRLVPIE